MSASQEYVKRRSNKDLFNRTKKEQQIVAREDSTGSSKHQQNPTLLTTGELFLCITLSLCIQILINPGCRIYFRLKYHIIISTNRYNDERFDGQG